MTKIIHDIINKNFSGAEKLVRENLEYIVERKIIEMKKMIAAKNVIKEESAIFELDTSNMRRSDNVEDRRDEVLKMPDDPIRDLINSTNKSKNTPDETPNDRVKGGFDAMFNPNNVNRDSKGDRDQLKEKAPPGAKYERMVKHIKANYAKDGLTDKEKAIAYATAWKAKNSSIKEETLDETVDYKMSYIKSHPEHVEIHHVTMSGHDNPYKTPERAKQQVRTNPKHEKLKDQGYSIHSYGEHSEPKDYYTRPVKITKEKKSLDEARFKIVKARIRNGVVQRRKKVSTAPGLTFRGGKLTRMSPAERRHRKMGQRRGKLKRRAKLSRTLRKRTMSLRKRSRLGIK
jgi:hypothetical protein